MISTRWLASAASAVLALGAAACGDDDDNGGGGGGQGLSGKIAIDGSSTVGPFAQAAAEQFQAENPGVQVTVGQSGTGGGFEKFCAGETDINDASRPIKSGEDDPNEDEAAICKRNGVQYRELQVGFDGIAVTTNKALTIDCMTTDQLKELWATMKVKNYRDLDPSFPDAEVSLYGAGTDSGTFDYFTEEINGEEGVSRKDYQPSEDDNVLVQGVAGDEDALGYFGFSYYEQAGDQLNLVGVDAGDGCVTPSIETIQNGEYTPLSRPTFMYPSEEALQRPEVRAFLEFVLENYETIADNSQTVPMNEPVAEESRQTLAG